MLRWARRGEEPGLPLASKLGTQSAAVYGTTSTRSVPEPKNKTILLGI